MCANAFTAVWMALTVPTRSSLSLCVHISPDLEMRLKIILCTVQRMHCSGFGSVTADTRGVIIHEQGTDPTAGCGPGRGRAKPEIRRLLGEECNAQCFAPIYVESQKSKSRAVLLQPESFKGTCSCFRANI